MTAVEVAYHKGYNLANKTFYVNGTSFNFKAASIVIDSINPKPSDRDSGKILTIVQSNLFSAINVQFKSMDSWLNDNAKK